MTFIKRNIQKSFEDAFLDAESREKELISSTLKFSLLRCGIFIIQI